MTQHFLHEAQTAIIRAHTAHNVPVKDAKAFLKMQMSQTFLLSKDDTRKQHLTMINDLYTIHLSKAEQCDKSFQN